jgi:hypothetical protein
MVQQVVVEVVSQVQVGRRIRVEVVVGFVKMVPMLVRVVQESVSFHMINLSFIRERRLFSQA